MLDAVFLVDAGGRIVYVNAACERIFGYTPAEMIGRPMIGFVARRDRERTLAEARKVMGGNARVGFENRYVRKDGCEVDVMWSARWSDDEQLRIGVARDVTERKHAERLQAATFAVSEAVHEATDLDALFGEIHRIVAELVAVAGFAVVLRERGTNRLRMRYLAGQDASTVLPEAAVCAHCERVMADTRPALLPDEVTGEVDQRGRWLALPLVAQHEATGVLLLRGGAIDIDCNAELLRFVAAQIATAIERGNLKAELLRAAQHDELTGLPNRRMLRDRTALALERCRRNGARLALLYVDVDDFKRVNDALGHSCGDALLREIATRLARCVRASDTVARMGGDEFVVLLEEVREPGDAVGVADAIREALAQPIELDGHAMVVEASIGIALFPEHGDDAGRLLRSADIAMYADKNGKAGGETRSAPG